jgi:hypothetical protein
MKHLILLPLIFSMIDRQGTKIEIMQVNDSTRIEVWHRNDTIFKQRIFKYIKPCN